MFLDNLDTFCRMESGLEIISCVSFQRFIERKRHRQTDATLEETIPSTGVVRSFQTRCMSYFDNRNVLVSQIEVIYFKKFCMQASQTSNIYESECNCWKTTSSCRYYSTSVQWFTLELNWCCPLFILSAYFTNWHSVVVMRLGVAI